jgi:AcrR family transcriptional regulator
MTATINSPLILPFSPSRRLLKSMRDIQAAAIELFECLGYEAVTVEAVAAAAEVSAPTVYRQFGSKERLVLWDEYDPMVFAAIRDRLRTELPFEAVRGSLIEILDDIYADDSGRIRRRMKLMLNTPALIAANAAGSAATRDELARLMLEAHPDLDRLGARLLGGVIMAALEVSVLHWFEHDEVSLAVVFDVVFARLNELVAKAGGM